MGTKCRIRFPNCYAHLVAMALLFLSGTGGQQDQTRQRLMKLFEEALVNSSDNLYALQDIYFNPSLKKSPALLVSVDVTVTVDEIKHPTIPSYISCYYEIPAFFNDSSTYTSRSIYTLQLQVDTQQLNDLLATRGTFEAFCSFESTFYALMIAMASPSGANYYDGTLDIHISKLEQMPYMEDAVYALQMVLVWVRMIN